MRSEKDDVAERIRLEHMLHYEKELRAEGFRAIAGLDEVGRGPLAGPVVSCAVILPDDFWPIGLNDSKKLSEKKREQLYEIITDNAVSYGVGIIGHDVIDRINILEATKQSMYEAIAALSVPADCLLIDAVRLDQVKLPQRSIIKGDSLSQSIAAASVVAKVLRDRMMCGFADIYPQYGFEKHKGYGTKYHMDAIKKYGITPIHRVSFLKNIVSGQIS